MLYFKFVRPSDIENYFFNEILCEFHHLLVITIGAIQFACRKLRIVSLINAFIYEIFTDFEYFRKASDDQLLKV